MRVQGGPTSVLLARLAPNVIFMSAVVCSLPHIKREGTNLPPPERFARNNPQQTAFEHRTWPVSTPRLSEGRLSAAMMRAFHVHVRAALTNLFLSRVHKYNLSLVDTGKWTAPAALSPISFIFAERCLPLGSRNDRSETAYCTLTLIRLEYANPSSRNIWSIYKSTFGFEPTVVTEYSQPNPGPRLERGVQFVQLSGGR